jgi:hypothetical protein
MRFIRVTLAALALAGAFVAGRTAATPPTAADAQVPQLSHFRCYTANFTATTAGEVPVALRDQFGTSESVVTRPELFCAPVMKRLLKTKPQQFPQPADHLTCYLAPGKMLGIVRTGSNQLGHVQVRDLTPRLLCVPTNKDEKPKV